MAKSETIYTVQVQYQGHGEEWYYYSTHYDRKEAEEWVQKLNKEQPGKVKQAKIKGE